MGNCLRSERDKDKEVPVPGIAYTVGESQDDEDSMEILKNKVVDVEPHEDPYVQRIADEIAEFREQLRRGQEQIQAMTNSVTSFDTSKSCPGLVELKETGTAQAPKPVGVTIGIQTDSFVTNAVAQTNGTSDDFVQMVQMSSYTFMEFMDSEELDDENRYRLRAGCEALSVIEESEQESELSPTALQRKMSAGKGTRPKLIRMRNTVDDPPPSLTEEDVKSDLDYLSAASSLSSRNPSVYNSLERPLHVAHGGNGTSNGNGDELSDTYSTVSGGNTTYGSPISSPSSPTYLTPSQGSSSQETLTNHDGDKTPIIGEDLQEDGIDRPESALRSGNSSSNSNYKPRSSWQMLPIDNRQENTSIGVIPDEDQERMRQYAHDVPQRSCNSEAAILSRKEWRTLRADLDQVDMEKFKKGVGQDQDPADHGFSKGFTSGQTDLDEVAESYTERFPFLAESIFAYLDVTAQEKVESVDELPELKKRFEELATTFRTDHDKLEGRREVVKNEHGNATRNITELISSLKDTVQTINSEQLHPEIREVFKSMETWVAEIDLQVKSLERAAQKTGRLDVVRRVFKIIEVMVLYVRILNTVCGNLEEEKKLARDILEERGIEFPIKKKTISNISQNNNNNQEKMEGGQQWVRNSSPKLKRSDNTRILQRLLGPKQSSVDLSDSNSEFILRRPQPKKNFLPRCFYQGYETILRELNWPWDAKQTWNGIRKTFAILLMLFGVYLVFRISFIPTCDTGNSFLFSFDHKHPPRI